MFMLPTRFGLIFALVLFIMLLAAVNYNNGLAYGFTFMLATLAMVSMLYTHRNLSGLQVKVGHAAPVFAGSAVVFPVTLDNPGTLPRSAVWLLGPGEPLRADLAPGVSVRVNLPQAAPRRGYVRCPPLRLTSSFPFGLLYTWSAGLQSDVRAIVYPRPAPGGPPPPPRDASRHHPVGSRPEGDDFLGLRGHQAGDPPRHVHWKAAARGQGLLTKRFGGEGEGRLWLDWATTPGADTEARLSCLCRWVIDCEEQGMIYGLRLPRQVVPPARGAAHRHRCLSLLALWGYRDD